MHWSMEASQDLMLGMVGISGSVPVYIGLASLSPNQHQRFYKHNQGLAVGYGQAGNQENF